MTFRILIKFGQHSHLEDLRSKGAVFTQPLRYFRELETDQARGDRLEGSMRILQPKHIGTMTLGDGSGNTVFFEPHEIVGPVIFGLPEDQLCNVFCMYSITRPTDLYPIDKRVESFGPSFVMVLNTWEFIRRFSEAAKIAGLSGQASAVEYFDGSEFSGDTGVFRKASEFDYQSEYRFALKPGSSGPITLSLGSLADIITEVMPTKDIAHLLNFSSVAAKKAGLSW
jgi:hypothetical protein